MKSLYTFILFFLLVHITGISQNYVYYDYDASGNRTNRTIVMKQKAPPAPQDSTENDMEESPAIAQADETVETVETGQENLQQETLQHVSQEVYTDMLLESSITIYPNPTQGRLAVRITNLPQNMASSLELFDIHGRSLIRKEAIVEYNELDISNQPPGAYIMRIHIDKEATTWKIIKQ